MREKEIEVSRLASGQILSEFQTIRLVVTKREEKEVEALRVVAPLLWEDKEAENDNKPTLVSLTAVNAARQPDHSGWEDRAKR
jgi:hypothetical protein